jgi:hypothetical protein
MASDPPTDFSVSTADLIEMIEREDFWGIGGPLKNFVAWKLLKRRHVPGFETDVKDEDFSPSNVEILMFPMKDT